MGSLLPDPLYDEEQQHQQEIVLAWKGGDREKVLLVMMMMLSLWVTCHGIHIGRVRSPMTLLVSFFDENRHNLFHRQHRFLQVY